MSRKADSLHKLERIAKLKSDLEMRRFSAFRSHLIAARARVAHFEDELEAIHLSDRPFSLAEARLSNALACETSNALFKAEAELARMLPSFDEARQRAVREFGRVEALKGLRKSMTEDEQLRKWRRLAGPDG